MIRGLRGATTVEENNGDSILAATKELMLEIQETNGFHPEDISHIIITMTEDLNATFPARVLRDIAGYQLVPVMCAQEIAVPGGLPKCIRLMVTVNTTKFQNEIKHIYLNDAVNLRPDLTLDK
ncbi:chorismate mutase [Salipaludibacillus neizhouensis]|uniref:chorismate mutase n=1 Tax=Salipaludibacillus neizhouensis TaxID=885475 RepID=A0A3A9KSE7_9BACI|nr:chorismate mutase [Salipaludibacillus neizhouensis]RKL67586.1 chorismate mutase [Salipaludibacillus neizhouensis]